MLRVYLEDVEYSVRLGKFTNITLSIYVLKGYLVDIIVSTGL